MQYAAATNNHMRATGGGGSGNVARQGRVSNSKTCDRSRLFFMVVVIFRRINNSKSLVNRSNISQ